MTVSLQHPVKKAGLDRVLSHLQCTSKRVMLLFVVPECHFEEFKNQTLNLNRGVDTHKLRAGAGLATVLYLDWLLSQCTTIVSVHWQSSKCTDLVLVQ